MFQVEQVRSLANVFSLLSLEYESSESIIFTWT